MIATLLAGGRAAHVRLMVDTVRIDRASTPTLNESTGKYTTASWWPIYDGPARVKGPRAGDAAVWQAQAGDAEQAATRQTLVLPHGTAAEVAAGDRVQVTGGPLTGTVWTVVGQVDASTMTARSVLIEQVDNPATPALGASGGTPADVGVVVVDGGSPQSPFTADDEDDLP